MGLMTFSIFKNLVNENPLLKIMSNEDLEHLQKVLLLMLKELDGVCKKNGINYMLGGGSCLGAIRHKGFIPWDDDVDLNMTREDYTRFKTIFKNELGGSYDLQTPETTKGYGLAFVRLRKKGTIFRSRDDYDSKLENGIYIDIFIIENTYNFVLARYFHGFLSLMVGFMLSCRNFYDRRKFYMDLAGNNKKIKRVFRTKIVLGFLTAWLSVDTWVRAWDKVNRMCKDNHSKYVTVPTGRRHFFGELYERNKFCKYQRVPFESLHLPVTAISDAYLERLYGKDYMTVPKKSQQEKHIFLELDFGDN